MKLLIFTQKLDMNDVGVLGFFHGWIEEFAKHCEKVLVICLYKGDYSLPPNVEILSLGKEMGPSRLKYLFRFYKYILQRRREYDAVFVHMNEIYVLLGGIFWKFWQKPIGFWYAHGKVKLFLRIVAKLADVIFTSTASGFRVRSQKVKIVGQGIDTEVFRPDYSKKEENLFKIVTVGRISPVKDYETLILACEILDKRGINFRADIIGEAALERDEEYKNELRRMIINKQLGDRMSFLGGVPNQKIISYLQVADLFVNMSHTGSLDKVILEAMACGLPVLTCNEALFEILGPWREKLIFGKKNFSELTQKIMGIYQLSGREKENIGQDLRKIVIREHEISSLINKILSELKK